MLSVDRAVREGGDSSPELNFSRDMEYPQHLRVFQTAQKNLER